MPPKIRYRQEDVARAALAITRRSGIAAVNARALAGELGCSTQPIFHVFQNMQEVKETVIRLGMERYAAYIARSAENREKPYLQSGLAYLDFAREEPELFKLLFMRDRGEHASEGQHEDTTVDYVIGVVMKSTGLARAQAEQFHLHMWVFVHGLATMIATHFTSFTQEQINQLMAEEYQALRKLYGLAPVGK